MMGCVRAVWQFWDDVSVSFRVWAWDVDTFPLTAAPVHLPALEYLHIHVLPILRRHFFLQPRGGQMEPCPTTHIIELGLDRHAMFGPGGDSTAAASQARSPTWLQPGMRVIWTASSANAPVNPADNGSDAAATDPSTGTGHDHRSPKRACHHQPASVLCTPSRLRVGQKLQLSASWCSVAMSVQTGGARDPTQLLLNGWRPRRSSRADGGSDATPFSALPGSFLDAGQAAPSLVAVGWNSMYLVRNPTSSQPSADFANHADTEPHPSVGDASTGPNSTEASGGQLYVWPESHGDFDGSAPWLAARFDYPIAQIQCGATMVVALDVEGQV